MQRFDANQDKDTINPHTPFRPSSSAEEGTRTPHFLLCVDRSALSERAVPTALKVARFWDARLTLLNVLTPQVRTCGHGATDALDWEIARTQAENYLEQLAESGKQVGVEVETRVAEGQAAEQIVHEAQALDVDLLILASHGAGGHLDWSVGTTTKMVASHAPTSLLIIPAERPGTPEPFEGKGVMVVLDGSPRAECAIPVAVHIARSADVDLLLVHVVTPPEISFPATLSAEDKEAIAHLQRRGERVAEEYLVCVKSRLDGHDMNVRTLLRPAPSVVQTLANVAREENVGVIVFSAHGSTGRDKAPHGGVVARCLLEQMPVPYLIIQDLCPQAQAWLKVNPSLHCAPARVPDLYREEQE